jgi:hypothetical protein
MSSVRSHAEQDRLRLGGIGRDLREPDHLTDNAEVAGSIPASPTSFTFGLILESSGELERESFKRRIPRLAAVVFSAVGHWPCTHRTDLLQWNPRSASG